MKEIVIKPYGCYNEAEILPLYSSVGWTAYTDRPDLLRSGFENSLFTLGAYDGERLVGLIRTVGDGHTIVYIQDLLVSPEYRRRGIGGMLITEIMNKYAGVRQIILATDDTEETCGFYKSVGLTPFDELGLRAFTK